MGYEKLGATLKGQGFKFKSRTRELAYLSDRGLLVSSLFSTLREDFEQKPGINVDLVVDPDADDATKLAAYTIANRNFELLGTNAASALCTFAAGGGIRLTTDTAANDQMILAPHLDTNQSAWAAMDFNTGKQILLDVFVGLGSSVANYLMWAGFKLTNTGVVATDNDQIFFRLASNANSGKFQFIHSRAGTDSTENTQITGAASTLYRLTIEVNAQRRVMAYINGKPIFSTPLAALTDNITLIPYVGVQTLTTAAKFLEIKPGYTAQRLAA